jgi:hypothetical protein
MEKYAQDEDNNKEMYENQIYHIYDEDNSK